MAQLVVRHLEDSVKEKLRRRAARRRKSLAAEVRDILRDAVARPEPNERHSGAESPADSQSLDWIERSRNFAVTRLGPPGSTRDPSRCKCVVGTDADPPDTEVVAWLDSQPWRPHCGVRRRRRRGSAKLAARRQRRRRTIDFRDTQIAGIALARRAAPATRNMRHFEGLNVNVLSPWAR